MYMEKYTEDPEGDAKAASEGGTYSQEWPEYSV